MRQNTSRTSVSKLGNLESLSIFDASIIIVSVAMHHTLLACAMQHLCTHQIRSWCNLHLQNCCDDKSYQKKLHWAHLSCQSDALIPFLITITHTQVSFSLFLGTKLNRTHLFGVDKNHCNSIVANEVSHCEFLSTVFACILSIPNSYLFICLLSDYSRTARIIYLNT